MPQAKPHFNILTLDFHEQGRTTLTDAIIKVLTKQGQTVIGVCRVTELIS